MSGVAVFALTTGGAETARRLAALCEGRLWLPERLPEPADRRFTRVGPALREAFGQAPALVCVMAAGIVVRALAPVLRGKKMDPAVLVVDEAGHFVVPLLSGHVGGANALARVLAGGLGARAVLTTSSDSQGLLGPDLLAEVLDAHVAEPARLLAVAAALVNGRKPEIRYDPAEVGGAATFLETLAGYRVRSSTGAAAEPSGEDREEAPPVVVVSVRAPVFSGGVLHLVPRWIAAGVGCKRGTPGEAVVLAVRQALSDAGLHPASLRALASVAAKSDEPGLRVAGEVLGVPVLIGPDEAVRAEIVNRQLPESEWVRRHIGLGAACEPAALWVAGEGARLVLPKQAGGGVTVALALADGGAMLRREGARWVP